MLLFYCAREAFTNLRKLVGPEPLVSGEFLHLPLMQRDLTHHFCKRLLHLPRIGKSFNLPKFFMLLLQAQPLVQLALLLVQLAAELVA